MANLLKIEREGNLRFALELLNQGVPVALPTETVYGLAARLDQMEAVARVFQLKNRPRFDPLIVHVLDLEGARKICRSVTELHAKLVEKFWPGPLTLLFEKNEKVGDLVTSGSEWVAIRSPQHPTFRKVLESLDWPYLVAPSANRFTSVSPTSAHDVLKELGPHGLEAVVDGGSCEVGVESTVVRVGAGRVEILRPGAVTAENIKDCLGPSVEVLLQTNQSVLQQSPGSHTVHYSPGVPAQFFESEAEYRAAPIAFQDYYLLEILEGEYPRLRQEKWKKRIVLGNTLELAAKNVFAALRVISDEKAPGFVAVATRPEGLGVALNDRLRRAAGKG